MRYDAEHKERTRVRLLTEAAIMLREEGPHGLSVVTLMKRQGLTHGGFYAHFESKDDLIARAIDVTFDRTCERFLLRTRDIDADAALTSYITYYLSPSHVNKPGQGCPIPAIGMDVARLEPLARKRFEQGVTHLATLIAKPFERRGLTVEHSHTQALTLLAEMSGAVIMARGVKTAAMSRAICAATYSAIVTRLGLKAVDITEDSDEALAGE